MHKILIVSKERDDETFFAEALAKIVKEGGELFFVTNEAAANSIFKREKPQMVLIDEGFSKDPFELARVSLIVLKRPFEAKQLLSLVQQGLGSAPTSTPKISPM